MPFYTAMPREGWKQATEVARTARQHKAMGPTHRMISRPHCFMVARPHELSQTDEVNAFLNYCFKLPNEPHSPQNYEH